MTALHYRVTGPEEAERARDALAQAAARLPLDPAHRARLLAEATPWLRRLAAEGGTVRVRVEGDAPEARRQLAEIAEGAPVDQRVLRPLLDLLDQQAEALTWHQTELEQTNAGLLALHAQLEEQRRRLAFLDRISRELAVSLDPEQVLGTLVRLLRQQEFADEVHIWTLDERGRLHQPLADGWERPDHGGNGVDLAQVLRSDTARLEQAGRRLSLPLRVGPQPLGVLALCRTAASFRPDEQDLASHIASRAALALRNAREYERERELAETLQRAMLPTLPRREHAHVWAEYRPATRGVNIGGDWYDAFFRADGSLVLAIGDVTGHGLDAAVLMGELQNALRAYAVEGHGPGTTLRLVHDLLRQQRTGLFATAQVAVLEPGGTVLRWASAGHLPMMVRDADGRVTPLERAQAPLLGVPMDVTVPEHRTELLPGGEVLLYTDGLVERRGSDLDAGLVRLAEAWRAAPCGPVEGVTHHLLDALLGAGRHEDDVCLLLYRHPA
ncbi:Serine phosphatase RsbU, regulator of sigma subunit [Streptoalloteichus tenebrarius]|uniref:Serine phosphatase RsbU, regulator of sigma subunit n=1 Tax=Streptoalloteichus tenebrarius (strain ATCC 17920 / DSM 40477 / JCM 4838 / CBS 697.72 / NBRC 16177 / NCIMB 11028 / NRRL B-12390 / A12253. 1 / ISP 5477) TaxID=1933 RepID=A0ABT1HSM3_STRSD|nr:GAF domain-containing SpoIIE family protein phosphatase [Streptoalloteichus tenebrarius]MCP2258511.1 Serine phosphatase RsbU, regulator of sigma subunit [Streptoalloteichus tenebrarius]BFF04126.1 SpoIIE family protein phosphatase [Streptoalloteichus tenebrarius]